MSAQTPEPSDGTPAEEREGLARLGHVAEEGEGVGDATPRKDLVSAAAIAALAVLGCWLSLRMENPGRTTLTSPGLLPFLVSASLLLMALAQLWIAVRRGAARGFFDGLGGLVRDYFQEEDNRSSLLLIGLVLAYVVLIDVLSFDVGIPLGAVTLRFSSFEAVTIVMLAGILRIFWKKPIRQCLVVSFLMSTGLAICFRYGFQLLMPGSG